MLEDENIFAYTRTYDNTTMLVACNFKKEVIPCELLKEWADGEVLITNYHDKNNGKELRPYEAMMIIKR